MLKFEQDGPLLFEHACLLGCEGIVSKRKNYWAKTKNPQALAATRELEEDWGKSRLRTPGNVRMNASALPPIC
jgi:hypothetical protein